MFKLENIVVANGITHYKLKQGNKIVLFNSNTLIGFTKVACIFIKIKKLLHYLLNSRWTDSLNISLFVVCIILIMQYVAWQRWISLNSHNGICLPFSNIKLNTNILQSKGKLTFSQTVNMYMYYNKTYFTTPFYKRNFFHMY
jgi:hypothetical protein